jgi:hypothetical protein
MPEHKNIRNNRMGNISSDRTFGIVFCIVFLIIGLWPILNLMDPHIWALAISITLLAISVFQPKLLGAFNILWYKFGLLLHKIMNPLLLGLIFFSTFVPIGLLMRLLGKRPLPIGFSKSKDSYWIERKQSELDPETMKRQF